MACLQRLEANKAAAEQALAASTHANGAQPALPASNGAHHHSELPAEQALSASNGANGAQPALLPSNGASHHQPQSQAQNGAANGISHASALAGGVNGATHSDAEAQHGSTSDGVSHAAPGVCADIDMPDPLQLAARQALKTCFARAFLGGASAPEIQVPVQNGWPCRLSLTLSSYA